MTNRRRSLLGWAVAAAGVGVWVWAFGQAGYRDAEGFPRAAIVVPAAAGAGLLIVAWGIRIGAFGAAAWSAIAILGQAVSLQLVVAGPRVAYQHYAEASLLVSSPQVGYAAFFVLQVIAVGVGLARSDTNRLTTIFRMMRPWQWMALSVMFVLTSATLSRDPRVYVLELTIASAIQLVSLLTVVLAASAVPVPLIDQFRMKFAVLGWRLALRRSEGRELDVVPLLCAVWVTLSVTLMSIVAYERHPHVPDEVVYLVHAEYLANGHLTVPPPPVPEAFDVALMMQEEERWYSPVPPGWPAMLAVGAFFGVTWLVNPVLAGINTLLSYLLVLHLYERRTARRVTVLLAVSPWYLFMAMNYMTHTFTLTCALVGGVCLARLREHRAIGWALLGGAAIGVTSLIRPLEGLAVAILLGVWALAIRGRAFRFGPAATLTLGALAVGGLQAFYNKAITGEAGTFPIMVWTDATYGPGTNALGFGPDRGLGWGGLDPLPGHGPLDVLINGNLNLFAINIELFGWAIGSLLLAAVLLLLGRLSMGDRAMLAVVAVVVGLHTFYYFSGGPDFGARYWYLVVVPLVALTSRGADELSVRMASAGVSRDTIGDRVVFGMLLLSLSALLTFVPWRALDKYHHYRGMRPDVRRLAEEHGFGRSLVLVRGQRHPDYASAVTYNPVDLGADVPIYAWDRDAEIRMALLREYRDRPVWIVNGPTQSKRGFEVVAGPLTPDEAAAVR